MTDRELAEAYGDVKQIESMVHASVGGDPATRMSVYRQAVALRRALGEWIVDRATSAHAQAAEAR